MTNTTRRSFLKATLATIVGVAAIPALRAKQLGAAFAADAGLKPLPETLDLAKNLGYKADGSKADPTRRGDKAGVPGNKQFCDGCQFYGGKPGEKSGSCTMFSGYTVTAKGWCSVWTKKA